MLRLPAAPSLSDVIEPNQHDAFVVKQKFSLVVNEYDIELPEGGQVAFVRQKPFAFKEELRFTPDRGVDTTLLTMKARSRFDPTATYDVKGGDGSTVGIVRKAFGASLLRSTWVLESPEGTEVATAREKKLWVALLRRLIGFVPYVGGVADWLPIPYDFVFFRGDAELAHFRRRRGSLRDTYDLDLSADADRTLDRRLVLAVAVGLDALQAR